MSRGAPLLVLEDDPTGTQLAAGVPFILEPSPATVLAAHAATQAGAVHLLTNCRAYGPGGAQRVVRRWAETGLAAFPGAATMLRGDSTLRGWPLQEVRGLRLALGWRDPPVLLLVAAFPGAGRVTRQGVHYVVMESGLVPVAETEFASDPSLGFHSSRLLDWADERSGGYFARESGSEVWLENLRRFGSGAILDSLEMLTNRRKPAVCAVDAESDADVAAAAEAWARARSAGLPVIARGSPAFATAAAWTQAHAPATITPRAGGVLVVVGSHVALTTRQLRHLQSSVRSSYHEIDVGQLLAGHRSYGRELAGRVAADLQQDGIAILATPRRVAPEHRDLRTAAHLARCIAGVVKSIAPRPATVISKGGITSALIARVGLGAAWATVVGPVVPGVSLWRIDNDETQTRLAVVPGNVGETHLLTQVVSRLALLV